jgi:hypothetical protein
VEEGRGQGRMEREEGEGLVSTLLVALVSCLA